MDEYGLKQHIKSPTRITSNTATLIDHAITNIQGVRYGCKSVNAHF